MDPIQLSDKYRVVDCERNIQWILQQLTLPSGNWKDVAFCRSRDGLMYRAHGLVNERVRLPGKVILFDTVINITEEGYRAMEALPEFHP